MATGTPQATSARRVAAASEKTIPLIPTRRAPSTLRGVSSTNTQREGSSPKRESMRRYTSGLGLYRLSTPDTTVPSRRVLSPGNFLKATGKVSRDQFVKIVECGSMNEASHELYVSQPALSSSVKELENELGIEIFTRSSQGIALTVDGAEFMTYARQVLDQADLLEERYHNAKPRKQLCSVSTQHYMFAVEAFVEMIDSIHSDEYEFTIRETRTKDIINQVANMLSET